MSYYSLLMYKDPMKPLIRIAFLLPLLLTPALSLATEAKVVQYKAECGYVLLLSDKGYLLLKNQGGNSTYTPKKGDVVEGAFLENYGINHINKLSSKEVMWVFNDSTWLSKEQSSKAYKEKCGKNP